MGPNGLKISARYLNALLDKECPPDIAPNTIWYHDVILLVVLLLAHINIGSI